MSKYKFKITIAAVLLFTIFLIVNITCTKQPSNEKGPISTLEKVKKEGILHVGYIIYPPTVMRDPNTGEITGHYVDAVEEIAKQLGVKVEYTETDWSNFVAGLQTGKYDLSIAATYRTIPRAKEVAFTRPLMYIGNSAIVIKGDTRFESITDLNREDITIAVTEGEQGYEYAKMYLTKAKLKIFSTSDQSIAFSEVSAGRADAALGDSWACKQYSDAHSEVTDLFANNPYNLLPIGWAVRHDDLEWLNFINIALDTLESTGKLKEFEEKYSAHWLHPKVTMETW